MQHSRFIIVLVFTILDMIDLWRKTRSADTKKMIYVRRFIKMDEELAALDFCRTKVTCDVIVLLMFIGAHASEVITTEILSLMWTDYR